MVKYRLNFAIFFSASWAALRAKGATWVKDFLSLRALHSRELFTHRWTLCPPCSHENGFAVGCGWELTTVGENWEPPGIWTMCVLAFLFFQAGGVAPPCFPAARRWIILYTLNWRKFKDLLVPSAYTSSCLHQFKNLQFRISLKLSGHLWIIIVFVCVVCYRQGKAYWLRPQASVWCTRKWRLLPSSALLLLLHPAKDLLNKVFISFTIIIFQDAFQ